MTNTPDNKTTSETWPQLANAAFRVAFGIIWVVNAAFTWMPQFATHYVGYLHNAAKGQASWSSFWFEGWISLVTPHASLFIWLTRIAVTALALALLFGFARKTLYVLGALFSILIWSTAEGFGGPYAVGAANMGTGLVYVLIFIALLGFNYHAGANPYSIDYYIERRWPGWRRVAEWSGTREPIVEQPVSWGVQIPVLLGIALLVFFLVAGLYSSLNVTAPSPSAAASAVSPMALASKEPIKQAYDARLPPLQDGPSVTIKLESSDATTEIISGVQYQAWPYGGTVPGPTIHVRQGQTINVEYTNRGTMHHSIDFHASFTPPNLHFANIMPGETIKFSFEAKVPGAFVYHCGTDPVLLHMANGMYGAIIVDPVDQPLPPADKEYVIVQGEWYTRQVSGNLMGPDYEKMLAMRPDLMAFNGAAFQYRDHPLPAAPGERVRLYMVNAGPSLWSAFHVIGAIFDKVYLDGNPANALSGVSTHSVAPGAGVVMDLVIPEAGLYPFVDHAFAHLEIGAVGILDIREPGTEHTKKPPIEKAEAGSAPAAAVVPPPASGPYQFDANRGASLYASTCAACHQATGLGIPSVFPPLKGNAAVLAADPTKQIRSILHGSQGEIIDGVAYTAPMPPFGQALSDIDVADIVNHERTSWGNQAKQVTPEQVQAQR